MRAQLSQTTAIARKINFLSFKIFSSKSRVHWILLPEVFVKECLFIKSKVFRLNDLHSFRAKFWRDRPSTHQQITWKSRHSSEVFGNTFQGMKQRAETWTPKLAYPTFHLMQRYCHIFFQRNNLEITLTQGAEENFFPSNTTQNNLHLGNPKANSIKLIKTRGCPGTVTGRKKGGKEGQRKGRKEVRKDY